MNPEVKAKWVAALRSGKFKQGKNALKSEEGYCCLGVLCELHARETGQKWDTLPSGGYAYDMSKSFLSNRVCDWAGLTNSWPKVMIDNEDASLDVHNDGSGSFTRRKSFEEIAKAIEDQL